MFNGIPPNWNHNYYYSWSNYSNVEVDVLSTSKNPIRKYSYKGKTFIEGKKGNEFSIRIKNPNSVRVEVVVSVDGLSVIDGKKAHSNSRSYVINAYSNLVIDGWRINNDEVRKFYFTDKDKSYSGKKDGDDENCGIISVLAYTEYQVVLPRISWIDQPYTFINDKQYNIGGNTALSSNVNLSFQPNTYSGQVKSEINSDSFDLGTGMGEKQESKVKETSFERGDLLGKTYIFYASRSSLVDMGIDVEKKPAIRLPQGFTDFCEEI